MDQENQFIPYPENREKILSSLKNNPQPISPTLSGAKFKEIEKNAIIEALEKANGNIPQAAKALGVSRATFYRKIKKYRSAS